MCYGCNGCDRCGKITRMRERFGRRFCPACGIEVNHVDAACPACGSRLPPLAVKAGLSSSSPNAKERE